MKIVHITSYYPPDIGGIANHVRQLAEAQAMLNHTVTVLALAPTPTKTIGVANGVNVIRVASPPVISRAIVLSRMLRRETEQADIAHVHSPCSSGELINQKLGRARCTVITWHTDPRLRGLGSRLYTPSLRLALRCADRIIATSEIYAHKSPWLRNHGDRCTVIPLGVDTARFDAARILGQKASAIRSQITAGHPAAIALLTVGKMLTFKSVDVLIRAVAQLDGVVAMVVGSGPLEASWRKLAHKLELADRVHFAGDVSDDDLPSYYQAADIYVLPSGDRSESFGLTLLEAMASGLPVISTEVGTATSWINQHNSTGLVVQARSPKALAQAIQQLSTSPLQRQIMGMAARQRALDEFTQQKMIARVMEVYQSVLALPGSG